MICHYCERDVRFACGNFAAVQTCPDKRPPDMSEQQYLSLLRDTLYSGDERPDRTGVGTLSQFGGQMTFDLSGGRLPVITTKKVHLRSVIVELLWMLKGFTTLGYLHQHGVTIWDEWADANGDLGAVYGAQWREWRDEEGAIHDQIAAVQHAIKTDPFSRRHVVSAWNVGDMPRMALSPCHCLFQFYVSSDGELSCHLYQRSADLFLGVPFNITSYALLTHMMAQVCGLAPGAFTHSFGDRHLYLNHREQAALQLSREPKSPPFVSFKRVPANVWEFEPDDIEVIGYQCHPAIPGKVAV